MNSKGIFLSASDTACSLATQPGGVIGVIRVSGERVIEVTDKVSHGVCEKHLTDAKRNTLHYGETLDKEGNIIDDVLVNVFCAPHSYTGENSTEMSRHGSAYILNQVVKALINVGCRQVQPGEYTQCAYLDGKMDLSQAEVVADLIAASNRTTRQAALSQLRDHFSSELSLLREQLLKMTSLLELELDFSDHEELEFADRTELKTLAGAIHRKIELLIDSLETGKTLKKGVPVAIVGKTSVGKSTLLNCLLHEEKAIVSDIHGTTRDVIEDTTEIKGVTFRFMGTVDIRHTDGQIEKLSIERAYQKMGEAAIVLWVISEQPTAEGCTEVQCLTQGKHLITIFNKIDSKAVEPKQVDNDLHTVYISAKLKQNIKVLERAIYEAADISEVSENSIIVTSARHYGALTHAGESILRVVEALGLGLSGDLVGKDLRICLHQLADITGGQITPHEVPGNIFKHFCIGE